MFSKHECSCTYIMVFYQTQKNPTILHFGVPCLCLLISITFQVLFLHYLNRGLKPHPFSSESCSTPVLHTNFLLYPQALMWGIGCSRNLSRCQYSPNTVPCLLIAQAVNDFESLLVQEDTSHSALHTGSIDNPTCPGCFQFLWSLQEKFALSGYDVAVFH